MTNRIAALALAALLLLACIAGCATPKAKNVEGTLEELIQKIYDNLGDAESLPRGVANLPLSEDMGINPDGRKIDYYIGSTGIPFSEGVASESLISAVAYSLVLLRMQDNADIEAAKKTIKDTVDPAKWICVAVDPSNVIVDSIGNLVFLVMSDNAAQIHESFLKLAEA
ncbi:MAG: hypothetical protein LBR72_06380 [Oscillospiraceae bacterium]|jgi:hypothetical protein|nr:hypothetical protein [Oscillospiraceae bacterium]